MKTLLLVRHAKSSWKEPALTDLQRPLKKRGIRNAMEMGQRISKLSHGVQRVFTSPAQRAMQTVDLITEAGGFSPHILEVSPDLYSFDYDDVMLYLRNLDDQWQSVAVVGHNPAITDLVNFLALDHIANIPTSGIALLELDINTWKDLKAGCARLQHYDFPKNDTEGEE